MKAPLLILQTILFFLLILTGYGYSQYGWQKIYNDTFYGIRNFNSFKINNISQKLIYIQRDTNFTNGNPNEGGRYLRLNKINNTWFVPANGFLNAFWFFCSCPNYCNPPRYICFPVTIFTVSPLDTQFIIRNLQSLSGGMSYCEYGESTFKTYNSGQNSVSISQFSSGLGAVNFKGVDIDPQNDSIVYIGHLKNQFTGPPCVFKSTNRGNNWFITDSIPNLSTVPYGFIKINPMRRSYVFAVTSSGMVLSTNSGYNFFYLNIPGFSKMAFDPVDSSIYGLTPSAIYKSTNHGLNWTQLNTSGISGVKHSIEISPDNHSVVYAGADLGLYRSNNGGSNWSLYNDSFNPSKRVIGISKDAGTGETLYAATLDAVYKVWGSWVGINPSGSSVPEKFALYQNHPNPFNPTTKIRFDITRPPLIGVVVKLIIYDILGREIAVLVNEELKPGTYEVDFDGTNFPSGVYYYRLSIFNSQLSIVFGETRKMVLIK